MSGLGGKAGDILDQLKLTTSKGRSKTFGGNGGNPGCCQIA